MGGGITEAGTPRRYSHADVIVRQGDRDAFLRLVTSGAVRLSAVTPAGREVVVGLLGPGDVFGEGALLGGGRSPVQARAVGEVTIVAISPGALRVILHTAPATSEEILRLVAARLHRTAAALEEALAHDVPTRISLRLRELARFHGTPDRHGVHLPELTQDELARMVGTTRETVNRSLHSLTERGLVRVEDRHYVIPDPEALVVASDR